MNTHVWKAGLLFHVHTSSLLYLVFHMGSPIGFYLCVIHLRSESKSQLLNFTNIPGHGMSRTVYAPSDPNIGSHVETRLGWMTKVCRIIRFYPSRKYCMMPIKHRSSSSRFCLFVSNLQEIPVDLRGIGHISFFEAGWYTSIVRFYAFT